MKYLVYIKTKTNYYYIDFIDRDRLDIITEAIILKKGDFFLDGKVYYINNLKEVRIFETENKEQFQKDLAASVTKVKLDHVRVDGTNKGYINPDSLKGIVKEVSGDILNFPLKIQSDDTKKSILELDKNEPAKDIFISHSSKDKLLIDKFVEKILMLGLGLESKDIFCTSTEGFGIRTGEDFRNTIKKNIEGSKITILLISPNYKESEVCLNEMGAAWVLNSKVVPVIIDPIDYKSVGVLMEPLQIGRLSDSSFLDELSKIISGIIQNCKQDIVTWNKHKSDFISFANNYVQILSSSHDSFPIEYFEQYLVKNIDINQILLEAHPTLLDCKKLFNEKYYREVFTNCCEMFSTLENERSEFLSEKYKTYKVTTATIPELINNNQDFSGGTVELAKNYIFNIDQKVYRVDFLENQSSERGCSYELFTYCNNRVVFFPKPYRLVNIKE